ncbi:peroxisomal membrane protein 11A [Latimeria chalumnae]|uniref:Peroxisomal biosis factor 11 alpha n=1 Tax=Latimeria chalumnae TaxID=7897 RepID=H3BFH3_LATCH|nr:PREDICTED: peroxisomal membrane protein 11A [Latimeria chalumnae]|eukprot:XP_005989840.1 PREDICTED: peroxisomal membrane protein 11A [Latimeria chalumnae]
MDTFVKFTNQSQGRDRIFRTTQYACAFLSYLLQDKADKEKLIKKLKLLESNMSSGRKLFRLGNAVHALEAAQRNIQVADPVLRFCLTSSSLNRCLYFICDNALWARSVSLAPNVDKAKWSLRASRCYFYTLLLSLARDFYQIAMEMQRGEVLQGKSCRKEVSSPPENSLGELACRIAAKVKAFFVLLYFSLRGNPPVLLDTVKNLCDLFIPLDRLGIYKTSPGVVSLCGLLSSILGILTVACPHLKLKP